MESRSIAIEKSFVIGYSSNLESVGDIAESLGVIVTSEDRDNDYIDNDSVFIATDKTSLTNAFESIANYINTELWQVSGPKLP